MSLYVRIFLETLVQLNNFQYHTQIDLRYRQGWQCVIFNILEPSKIVKENIENIYSMCAIVWPTTG